MATQETRNRRVVTNCEAGDINTHGYQSRRYLLTAGEQRFYRTGLLPAIDGRYAVSMKVRLADVITCSGPARSTAFRKIQSKHLDFVLTTPKTCRIVAAIELNDASHDADHRQTRDAFVANALHVAGIPLIVIPVFKRYRPDVILHYIDQVLKRRSHDVTTEIATATSP